MDTYPSDAASQRLPSRPISPSTPVSTLASIWRRVVAQVVDGWLIAIPLLIVAHAAHFYTTLWAALLFAVVHCCYEAIFLIANHGQTIGKRLLGIRVIASDGGKLSVRSAFLRGAIKAVWSLAELPGPQAIVVGAFGLLDDAWAIWDRDRQALHDKAAGTRVVRVEKDGLERKR